MDASLKADEVAANQKCMCRHPVGMTHSSKYSFLPHPNKFGDAEAVLIGGVYDSVKKQYLNGSAEFKIQVRLFVRRVFVFYYLFIHLKMHWRDLYIILFLSIIGSLEMAEAIHCFYENNYIRISRLKVVKNLRKIPASEFMAQEKI